MLKGLGRVYRTDNVFWVRFRRVTGVTDSESVVRMGGMGLGMASVAFYRRRGGPVTPPDQILRVSPKGLQEP